MTDDTKQLYALWDEFLHLWPVARLEQMTLAEYSTVGDQDCFGYWLEHRLKELGSLRGGSAFKFGVFNRSKGEEKLSTRGLVYEEKYAFQAKLGSTSSEAFATVRMAILQTVRAAHDGDYETIQTIRNLGPVVKWKIAFLYQNRDNPAFPPIYADKLIRAVAGVGAKASHLEAVRALMGRFDKQKEDILTFYRRSLESAIKWLYPDYDPNLSKEKWLELLHNSTITTENTLMLLAHMKMLGGAATCAQLSKKFGRPEGFYISNAANFGRRVIEKTGLQVFEDPATQQIKYWVVPFKGRYVKSDIDENVSGNFIWKFREPLAEALSEMDLSKYVNQRSASNTDEESGTREEESIITDEIDEIVALLRLKKNLILQGAPGTGKTYRVPEIVTRLCGLTKSGDDHQTILGAYKKLKELKRVDFTTFHPSFDYENFVEGWQPVDNGRSEGENETEMKSEFEIGDGIFKQMADRAAQGVGSKNETQLFPQSTKVWKVSLGGTYKNPLRDDCLKHNRIRIGCWGNEESDSCITKVIEEGGSGAKPLNAFFNRMKRGDLVVSCYSQTETDAIGIIEGDVEWLTKSQYDDYRLCRKVRWLWKGAPEDVSSFMDDYNFTLSTVYSITRRFTPARIQDFLANKHVLKEKIEYPPFVLVIDEINRGNISKIFGELITLLEADKRKGAEHEESCRLPYSKTEFFVPENLYIIGTMNTADRSIGTLDYALRRRFAFYSIKPRCLEDEHFDREMFLTISRLFVEDPEADNPKPNRDTLSEEFEPLDVWLGHSYFLADENTRLLRWQYEIRPILMEYLRDGVLKPAALDVIQNIDSEFQQ